MISRIPALEGSFLYHVPFNVIGKNKPDGHPVLSGYIIQDVNELAALGVSLDDEFNDRTFSFQAYHQKNSISETMWVKVPHCDSVDLLPVVGPALLADSKQTHSHVYLADDDAVKFLNALSKLGIDYDIVQPVDRTTGEPTTVENSRINKFADYRLDKLAVSYYESRIFEREDDSRHIAEITNVRRSGNHKTEFDVVLNGDVHKGVMRLQLFSERYLAVPNSDEKVDNNIDLYRYAATGIHKLAPSSDDIDYLNVLSSENETLLTNLDMVDDIIRNYSPQKAASSVDELDLV